MLDLFIESSRFVFIISIIGFIFLCYKLSYFEKKSDKEKINFVSRLQKFFILITHFFGFFILIITEDNRLDLLILYVEELMFFIILWYIISRYYRKSSRVLWNISLYLVCISFIILSRLHFDTGYRQFIMAILGYIIALIVPVIIQKLRFLAKLEWLFIILSIALLLIVNVMGVEKYGATNWLIIGEFSFQPSEVIKLLFVFFLSGYLHKKAELRNVVIAAVPTLVLIILLVYQKDLGAALIFSITFITLVYLSTDKALYFLGGLSGGSIAAFLSYKLYSHVQVRVEAWLNPWEDIDRTGYQIAQSLFAIGAGGWLGYGFNRGMPTVIPVVSTDFIFAAICEEFGNIFSIALIILIGMFFLGCVGAAKNTPNKFYYLVASGISCTFAFQTFLIVGGVTKLIPLTGVTLPFISYGGSSLIVSITMLSVIQGIYNINNLGDDKGERTKRVK